MNAKDFRRIALSLDGVEEGSHLFSLIENQPMNIEAPSCRPKIPAALLTSVSKLLFATPFQCIQNLYTPRRGSCFSSPQLAQNSSREIHRTSTPKREQFL